VISTHARSAVILRIEAEGVGISFWNAEGLVTVSCRVVADVNLVVEGAAGVIFDNTEVIVRVVWLGVSDQVLEFLGASLLGFLLSDEVVRGRQSAGRCLLLFLYFIVGARTLARKLESVLNGLAYLFGVATLGDFGIIGIKQPSIGDFTVLHPDIDDGNLSVFHALSGKLNGNHIIDI